MNPTVDDIDILDAAHSLSNLCRFTGHCTSFYSVAQHSVLVSYLCKNYPLWGLLHDFSECMTGDCNTILKYSLGMKGFRQIEHRIMNVVCTKFNLVQPEPAEVKFADRRILLAEKRDLLEPNDVEWQGFDDVEPYPFKIEPWSPAEAKTRFLARFYELTATYNKVAA